MQEFELYIQKPYTLTDLPKSWRVERRSEKQGWFSDGAKSEFWGHNNGNLGLKRLGNLLSAIFQNELM